MRTFANLFLFFFLTDGLLSTIDDLLGLAFGIEGLSPLRTLNALATLFLAVALFFSLGIDRRLPKRIFLPLCLFLLWSTTGCWPLVGMLTTKHLLLLASLLQLLLGVLTLIYLRWRSGTSIQLTNEDFNGPPFSLGNTLGYFALTLLALPLLLGYTALATISQQVDAQTAGFMRISPVGLYMKERIYQQQDKKVRLTGMIHIGESSYFHDLAESLEGARTIVLAEGVSDKQGLLTSRFDYGDIGNLLGLTTQDEMEFAAHKVSLEELDDEAADTSSQDDIHIAVADIDLSSFTPLTVEFLNVLGRLISAEGSFQQNYAAYNDWLDKHMSPELYDTIMGDILDKRNAALIGNLDTALQHYDTVVIPWGAMHMPALESELLAQGFHQIGERERLSLEFATLPISKIVAKLGGENTPALPVSAESPNSPQSGQ